MSPKYTCVFVEVRLWFEPFQALKKPLTGQSQKGLTQIVQP